MWVLSVRTKSTKFTVNGGPTVDAVLAIAPYYLGEGRRVTRFSTDGYTPTSIFFANKQRGVFIRVTREYQK